MSIDHGKVLALADDIENRGDKWAADKLRALAQPAEAVELPTPYHYADGGKGEPLFTANQVRAAVAVATDAAQGAVAKVVGFDRGLPDLEWVNTVPLAKGDNLYTHPQAAPAQGASLRHANPHLTKESVERNVRSSSALEGISTNTFQAAASAGDEE